MNETLKDRFGNEITVGSIVTYPQRSGSSLWMVDGEVTLIDGNRVHIKTDKKYSWQKGVSYTDKLDRLTVVKAAV